MTCPPPGSLAQDHYNNQALSRQIINLGRRILRLPRRGKPRTSVDSCPIGDALLSPPTHGSGGHQRSIGGARPGPNVPIRHTWYRRTPNPGTHGSIHDHFCPKLVVSATSCAMTRQPPSWAHRTCLREVTATACPNEPLVKRSDPILNVRVGWLWCARGSCNPQPGSPQLANRLCRVVSQELCKPVVRGNAHHIH